MAYCLNTSEHENSIRDRAWSVSIDWNRIQIDVREIGTICPTIREELIMTFPVTVQPSNGQFAAALVGAPDVRALSSSRAEALAALQVVIEERIADGELVALEVRRSGVSSLAGIFRDDPSLRQICDEAYQERNAEFAE